MYEDDRTTEQHKTHTVVIGGTDRFLSGWGQARGGTSVAGWACEPRHSQRVWRWVAERGDMKRVRHLGRNRNAAHVHVYVVDNDHPALRA